jgi:hypothetical protein
MGGTASLWRIGFGDASPVAPGAGTLGDIAMSDVTSLPGVRFHTDENGGCVIGFLEALFASLGLVQANLTNIFR